MLQKNDSTFVEVPPLSMKLADAFASILNGRCFAFLKNLEILITIGLVKREE